MAAWTKFDFDVSGPDSGSLTEARHIVHAKDFWLILARGKIPAQIVYDESIFNETRHYVTWLSANTWADGSIYGGVEIVYEWARLAGSLEVFWVETISKYNPPAVRFFLTAKQPTSFVTPYDLTSDDGPLKLADGTWYRNSHVTAEFMIEASLLLSQSAAVNFVEHNSRACRLYGADCAEKTRCGSKLPLALSDTFWGQEVSRLTPRFSHRSAFQIGRPSTTSINGAYSELYYGLGARSKGLFKGKISDLLTVWQ